MRKVTIESFCRDRKGHLNGWPIAQWCTSPFRIGGKTLVTNGHLLMWRSTRPEDRAWPVLTDDAEGDGVGRRGRVLKMTERHPGAAACVKPWPTSDPVKVVGPIYPTDRVYFPQKLRFSIDAAYRDRVAQFGKTQGVDVFYATPRSNKAPVAFVVGTWRGLLMPLWEY